MTTIQSFADYLASARQDVLLVKSQTATSVAATWHTTFDRNGNPGAGSLSIGNTTTGVVPDDTVTGFPGINSFGVGASGYITRVVFGSTVASRLALFDRLFHAGSVSCTANATTTLGSQPSYSGRCPGSSYVGLQIWLEINAAVSNNACNCTVTYTNQDGTPGRSTGAVSLQNFITGRLVQLPLQAGDTGVQTIESIQISGSSATTGSVNVIVARPLWTGRVRSANDGDVHGMDRSGMQQIYDTSALWLAVAADSTSTGVPELLVQVANK